MKKYPTKKDLEDFKLFPNLNQEYIMIVNESIDKQDGAIITYNSDWS